MICYFVSFITYYLCPHCIQLTWISNNMKNLSTTTFNELLYNCNLLIESNELEHIYFPECKYVYTRAYKELEDTLYLWEDPLERFHNKNIFQPSNYTNPNYIDHIHTTMLYEYDINKVYSKINLYKEYQAIYLKKHNITSIQEEYQKIDSLNIDSLIQYKQDLQYIMCINAITVFIINILIIELKKDI